MSQHYLPQIARIEDKNGENAPYCPVCGQPTIKFIDNQQDINYKPCQHLVFIYVNEIDEFEYKSKDFKKRIKKLYSFADDDYFDLNEEVLSTMGYDDSLLVLEITVESMACGPTSSTMIFAFDFGYEEDD